ncbi:MAG: hypothetical protein SH856_01060 [Flavobacteriales bacterium]|nr:hypothetical protein [Flavobacteriales bacterium]
MKRVRWKRWLVFAFVLVGLYFSWRNRYDVAELIRSKLGLEMPQDPRPAGISNLEWCERNYSKEISELSEQFNLPYEYLMALIVLECGGNKPAGHRLEKHVLSKLKKVRNSKLRKLENVHHKHLKDCDDAALENLARSWGPFQLMGYKVIGLGVNVNDIREEEDAAYWGAKWIKNEYGHFLKKKKWKDAFHYHNTGDRFPLSGRSHTHDPYYVSNGLKYMKYFEKRNSKIKAKNPSS